MKETIKEANSIIKLLNCKDGITLVALVISVIVMVILAGVSISALMKNEGLFARTANAREKYRQASQNETETINQMLSEYYLQKLIWEGAKDFNQDITDKYGNPLTIPAGFSIVPDGKDNVEYNYSGTKIPTVQDGIVIEDKDGNQFVWIPVGDIKNKDGSITNITLGRYTFDKDSGLKELQQDASDYESVKVIEGYYREIDWTYGAKNLKAFITNTKQKGGYYIGRYEASKGSDEKAESKQATTWYRIDHAIARSASYNMYQENEYFETDLMNSYAWDTAIVFIQSCTGKIDYAIQKSINTTFGNTGEREDGTTDKICNIYDMSSNYAEANTEYSTAKNDNAVWRGGEFHRSRGIITSGRYCYMPEYASQLDWLSFRTILYILK